MDNIGTVVQSGIFLYSFLEYNQDNFYCIGPKNLTLWNSDVWLWLFGVEKCAAYGVGNLIEFTFQWYAPHLSQLYIIIFRMLYLPDLICYVLLRSSFSETPSFPNALYCSALDSVSNFNSIYSQNLKVLLKGDWLSISINLNNHKVKKTKKKKKPLILGNVLYTGIYSRVFYIFIKNLFPGF